jgi:hypothetical protein
MACFRSALILTTTGLLIGPFVTKETTISRRVVDRSAPTGVT